MSSFTPAPFQPNSLLKNAHVQTIVAHLARVVPGISYRRVRLDTPDGDFLDLDFPEFAGISLPENAPLLIGLHGLEGSARAGYLALLYRLMARQGVRSVGINYRSCSGEINRTAKLYHLGSTDDVAFAHAWIDREFPGVKKIMAGFSLGANLLLKYLGEGGEALRDRVVAAVAVSPPFDTAAGPHRISYENGLIRFYRERILEKLRRKVQQKADLIRAAGGDVEAGSTAQTLEAFDNAIIVPLYGFKDAMDYYNRTASGQYLPHIRVPTLILRSLDDPFFNVDIPHPTIQNNPHLVGVMTEHGGHVGFIEGIPPFTQRHYAQEEAARFFASVLNI